MKKAKNRFGFINRRVLGALLCLIGLVLAFFATRKEAVAQSQSSGTPGVQGIYRGLAPVVQFDVSRPLREMTPLKANPATKAEDEERDILPFKLRFAPELDPVLQSTVSGTDGPGTEIPGPIVTFNGQAGT